MTAFTRLRHAHPGLPYTTLLDATSTDVGRELVSVDAQGAEAPGLGTPYGAPQTASASADNSAWMNVPNISRNRSGDAIANWSCRNSAGSILVFAVIA
ncbi:hypothetical protein EV648_113277 [Kribbella sp. VKM Ac-2568]|nr:hypothetical protein EV648_113277 [Kribbella sp. VKM Ac-2568]